MGRGATAAVALPQETCAHCGLPVPDAQGGPPRFCCAGCRAVYDAIHALGLDRFYDLREPTDAGVPARTGGADYAWLDHGAFQDSHVRRTAAGDAVAELVLEGIHCSACVWIVERLPRVLPGVVESRLDVARRVVRVVWDPRRVSLSRAARTLDSLGYPSHPYRSGGLEAGQRREDRRWLIRIGVAGALAGNVMLISFALFGGMFAGMDASLRTYFRWISLGLTLLALAGPGRLFLVGALSSLRARAMHMDLPVALALVAGTAWGAVNTARGTGETYFESLTAVIFLLLVGRHVLYRQQRAARDSVQLLYGLTPATTRRIEADGAAREVPVEALQRGDRVELRAGESVPADGRIVEGRSRFDLSLLSGESEPVALGRGDRAWAGTHGQDGRVVLEVEATGAETRVGRLMALVEEFSRDRPPVVRLADRAAHGFVLAVLAAALATAGLWWSASPAAALENAIALLIVTCPCALGLATPLAIVAAIGRAAQSGILIKGGEALETLAGRGRLLLDKTGTITAGRPALAFWEGDDAVRGVLLALEAQVAHPIARAFLEAWSDEAIERPPAEVRHVPGRGLEGSSGGRAYRIGSPRFVLGGQARAAPWVARALAACAARSLSPIVVAADGEVAAVAGIGDAPHADARDSIGELRAMGWEPSVLSGDDERVVAAVARQVGLHPGAARGGVDPLAKAAAVRSALAGGRPVVMVGDGVNDAAALAAASAGVAVHGGAEASLAAADVYLREPGLRPLVRLFTGARRTMRVIRRNVAVSLLYNAVAGGLAVAGRIDPLLAAILMPISSLTVVLLSYRSRTF